MDDSASGGSTDRSADTAGDGTEPRPVTTTATSFEVLEQLRTSDDPLGPAALGRRLDLARSTVHRHLATLERLGAVVRAGDDRRDGYRVGLRLLDFGLGAREAHRLYPLAAPKVDELAEETGEKVWCIVPEGSRSVHLYGAAGRRSVRTGVREGSRGYLHQHAAGKAILAHLPADRVREIVDTEGLPAQTPETVTDESELFEQLERIRERGYAFNREESVPGLHAVGAPVRDESGVAVGAISVSGPANRLKGERLHEALPDLLLGATNEVEINLSHG
ncbi:IclR family transcriptional regulator [Halobium salinum]|uniref:IclR family transcriptional regulator n=1 Tax=Halobium salinum TaxID=1364940 RepID=A0ABD5PAY1_9EURY|nr:IclR family transcriptional regulator [Halobium salinum]